MNKKVVIIVSLIILFGIGISLLVLNLFKGERESKIEKLNLKKNEQLENDSIFYQKFSGNYAGTSKNNEVELLFSIEGLNNTKGAFEKLSVEFDINDSELNKSTLYVKINSSSINTENKSRDKHLRDFDFFNVTKFPEISYKSTHFTYVDSNKYIAHGKLFFLGKEYDFDIPFHYLGHQKKSNEIIKFFESRFEFDRTKFGMSEVSTIGNEVTINLYLKLKKTK